MQKENESMRAVGYARVSSKDQEDSGYSLPAQEKLLREQAERNGYDLVKVFAIQESAAGKIQRKIFHEINIPRKRPMRYLIGQKPEKLNLANSQQNKRN